MQVLLLDADCQPLRQPETLFSLPAYREHGNAFWRDYWTANAAAEVCLKPAFSSAFILKATAETMFGCYNLLFQDGKGHVFFETKGPASEEARK